MVVQLEEITTGSTVCIGNVHLPAKPADIKGRLQTLATTVKQMEGCEQRLPLSVGSAVHSLDGTLILTGDFNCEHHSVVLELLKKGQAPYGTLRDRNYKARIAKDTAYGMRHDYRFRDVYQDSRESIAPVTVSLKGRGPGCMDQMFFCNTRETSGPVWFSQNSSGREAMIHTKATTNLVGGKRKNRRVRAQQKAAAIKMNLPSVAIRIQSILATVDENDPDRLQTILDGLPNEEKGFPSDHLPIGALFVPVVSAPNDNNNNDDGTDNAADNNDNNPALPFTKNDSTGNVDSQNPSIVGGVSVNARRRRETYQRSVAVRRRHNAVLRVVADWLQARGATNVLRDTPLHRWPWVVNPGRSKSNKNKNDQLTNKKRAPDLCCVMNGKTLVIVEVTVGNNRKADVLRSEKIRKYQDVRSHLETSPPVVQRGLEVANTVVIVAQEDGTIPDDTKQDLRLLADLCGIEQNDTEGGDAVEHEVRKVCRSIQQVLADAEG